MPRSAGSPIGRAYQARPLPVKRWELGPWKAVNRADGSRPPLDTLYAAYNGMILPSDTGAGIMVRPGLDKISATALGSGSTRVGQLVFQYNTSDGTRRTLAIAGGKFYVLTWDGTVPGAGSWAEAITAGGFAAATGGAVTLSTTARCYACVCGNKLIVSDGTNTPFMWDGTTVTKLTNAPIFYGQPVVYGAKVFAIKNTELDTIVWSEENDPTIGYETGGYNNSWTLSQTGSENLVALGSTNEALYFFRRDSVGAIHGAVNPDFQTSATRDSVSTVIGCGSPGGVLVYDKWVWFLDMRGRIHRFAPGGAIEPIWEQHAADSTLWEDAKGLNLQSGSVPITELGYLPVATDLVPLVDHGMILAYQRSDTFGWRVYGTALGRFQGIWVNFLNSMILGAVYDSVRALYVTIGIGLNAASPSTAGVTYAFREPETRTAGFSAMVGSSGMDVSTGYGMQIVTQPIGLNEALNWRFIRATIRYDSSLPSNGSPYTGSLQALVPADSLSASSTAPTAQSITFQQQVNTASRRFGVIDVGLNVAGRSMQLAITTPPPIAPGGWVRITGITVEAVPLDQTVEPY
jgi:hypothetical protein